MPTSNRSSAEAARESTYNVVTPLTPMNHTVDPSLPVRGGCFPYRTAHSIPYMCTAAHAELAVVGLIDFHFAAKIKTWCPL